MSRRKIAEGMQVGAGLVGAALVLVAAPAAAQSDVRMIRPNVMILLDTSGSMEWRTGVSNRMCIGADGGPCNRCSNGTSMCAATCPPAEQRNRWTTAVEVLTGSIQNFSCVERPRTDSSAYDYLYPINYHEPLSNGAPLYSASAVQAPDGILDTYADRVRFGLMTFDNDYRTGLNANDGLFSYGYNRTFRANGCLESATINVGARRPSSDGNSIDVVPGGLISVGSPLADSLTLAQINQQIQTTIIGRQPPGGAPPVPGIRPYGGTPIAGMLDDAYIYWTTHPDVVNNAAGGGDPYFACRARYNVLITDGQPNMDFRPTCEGGGVCPYDPPAVTAMRLADPSGPGVRTFVIAFNASDPDVVSALEPIAVAGRTSNPCAGMGGSGTSSPVLFANNRAELQRALSCVLDAISAQTSTRTAPAFGVASAGTASSTLYQFQSSFAVASGYPWEGVLERRRTECAGSPPVPVDRDIDPSRDDFGALLHHDARSAHGWGLRRLWTFVPTGASSVAQMRATITRTAGSSPAPRTMLGSAMNPALFNVATPAERDQLIAWLRGDAGTVRENRPLGDIFHSNPIVVGPPVTPLPDQTFAAYRRRMLDLSSPGTWRTTPVRVESREQVVYVGTNDGILHAFNADTGEEIWGFVPPYLTGSIRSMYPANHQYGVDGTPVVRELVYTRSGSNLGSDQSWRTVLLVGLRGGGGAYEALDVTDPYNPVFLWQFTDTDMVNTYAIPAMGSVFTRWGSSMERVERAVAVIPGGQGTPAVTCDPSMGRRPATGDPRIQNAPPRGAPRPSVRCWQGRQGQYLYVVDVETGQLIRKFGPTGSPLVGSPALYVGTEGSVATRAYVGDADGAVWRLDMSDPDPANWRFGIAFDVFYGQAYNAGQPIVAPPVVSLDRNGDTLIAVGTGDPDLLEGFDRNRIAVYREHLTVAPNGVIGAITFSNHWEITDGADPSRNLYVGERLTGPLTLFNGVLYFGTFVPANSTDQCQMGYSRLWGVDEIEVSGGLPVARLDVDGDPATTADVVRVTQDINGNGTTVDDANSVLFGVGVVRRPSCVTTATTTDPYLGGVRQWVENITGGEFRLVAQTGRGGTSAGGSRTNVVSRTIPPPITQTRIDAWAVVFE